MASRLKNLSSYAPGSVPSARGMSFGILVSQWNPEVTGALLDGCRKTLVKHGARKDDLVIRYVPGSFELPSAAAMMAEIGDVSAIICLGCVIQGETRHFEFISQAVANGLTRVSIQFLMPVIFGVLTTDTMQQARDRAGGRHGNKGVEAAVAAIQMIDYRRKIPPFDPEKYLQDL